MKNKDRLHSFFVILIILIKVTSVYSQTMTGTVLTQPCNNNGQIGVTVVGMTPPISFTYANAVWGSNIPQVVHSNVSTNTDVLTGIAAYYNQNANMNTWDIYASNGTSTAAITLTLMSPFTMSLNVIFATCPAQSTIQAINFSGGTSPFTCAWTNTVTNVTYNTNPAQVPSGIYSVVVSDAAGCKVSTSGTTNLNVGTFPGVSLNANGTNANCTNGTATVTPSGGTAPYTYQWSNGATTQAISNLIPGYYSCTVTSANGCQNSTGYQILQGIVINANISGSPANCTNGTATVVPTGGTAPYSCLWNNGSVNFTRSGLMWSVINCTITDVNGCKGYGNYSVPQSVTINYTYSPTNATCLQNNGSVISFVNGGTAPYAFNWSNGATTPNLTNLQGGQFYSAQIVDALGCQGFATANVGVNSPVNVTYTSTASSCTTSTGAATLSPSGGTAPYSFLWYLSPNNSAQSSVSGLPIGNYNFKVTDAVGCIATGFVNIPTNSNLGGSINALSVPCPLTTGSLQALATGTNQPFTYLWSNAATTSVVSGVNLGNYSCVITDNVGCSVTKYGSLHQYSPINVGFNVVLPTCIFSTNGSLIANATGGVSPYTYSWSNGQTGPSITNLSPGNYHVSVVAANGCSVNSIAYLNHSGTSNSCYCVITGTVFNDMNNNCAQSFGELGIPNIQVHCAGFGSAYTDANGVYSFMVPTGTYTLSESVQQYYPLATCQNNQQVVNVTATANCIITVNFANTTVPVHDLHIITSNLNAPVPGSNYNQMVIVQNEGTLLESSIRLAYGHDGKLNYTGCSPWTLTQPNSSSFPNWYRINSGFQSLAPNGNANAFFTYHVPSNIALGTIVNCNDTVSHLSPINNAWLLDNTPLNNIQNNQAITLASYDPNFKEVSPAGEGPLGNISNNDSVLTYVVHFQNTGTYFAQNIVVIDTLDPNVQVSSVRPGYSKNKYKTTIDENGVCKFNFENINLPWQSNYGDALSSSLFVYSVKLKNNLPIGTQIKNKAAIYFDYNLPIITNTTRNTISSIVTNTTSVYKYSTNEILDAMLYPIPASNKFFILIHSKYNENANLSIFDIGGRLVNSKEIELKQGETILTEDTSNLQQGIYFVKIKNANYQVVKKLIIDKN